MRGLRFLVVALAILAVPVGSWPCSWAVGYFYQVTCLRGRVVGSNSKWVSWSRSWRQSRGVSNAKVSLYIYTHPWTLQNPVAEVSADSDGRFDLGSIPKGHYMLAIKGNELEDAFDVEITDKAKETKSILIDISPVTPDCKGGHEFIIKGT